MNRFLRWFSLVLFSLPLLSALERVIRGRDAILLFYDIIFPLGSGTVFLAFFRAGNILFSLVSAKPINSEVTDIHVAFAWLIFLVSFLLITTRTFRELKVLLFRRAVFWDALSFLSFLILASFWCWGCIWIPTLTAASGGMGIVFFIHHYLRKPGDAGQPGKAMILFTILLAANPVLFLASNVISAWTAERPPSERICADASYDAAENRDGTLVVLSKDRSGIFLTPNGWKPITGTDRPQRLVLNGQTGEFHVANYLAEENRAVTTFFGTGRRHHRIPDIDHFSREDRVVLACEVSNSLLLLERETFEILKRWDDIILPYAVIVDQEKGRAYVSTEHGMLYALDLRKGTVAKKRLLFSPGWGIGIFPPDGSIWVARPFLGEVTVMNADLEITARIRVGFGPRDIAVAPERNLILVGNYVTGTVSVLDARKRELIKTIWVGPPEVEQRLRGVEISPDGSWLVSKKSGVWRVRLPIGPPFIAP